MERNNTALTGIKMMIADGIVTQEAAEKYFPELKESEDEKIRKALIRFHKSTIDVDGIKGDDVLAWLEKQGEQKPKISSNYFRDEYVRLKECAIKENPSKENPYSGVSFRYNGHTWGMCARDNGVEILVDGEIKERVYLFDRPQGKSALETLKEEKVDNQNCFKPTDKVEPKFHKGDWVVDKDGHIFKIMRVDNDFNHITYACRPIEENSKDWASYSENDIRLWDITEDAKAGDVLNSVRVKATIIFKKWNSDGKHINAYCALQKGILIKQEMLWDRDFEPATKEQRDALKKAIVDAGYTFDYEKKKWKKIEVLIPQKPAEWSEEDEGICRAIINDIANDKSMCTFDISKGICDKKIKWLESIKERVACEANCTTAKQWKPSDEQIKELEFFIFDLPKCSVVLQKSKDTLLSLLSDLKKLREE